MTKNNPQPTGAQKLRRYVGRTLIWGFLVGLIISGWFYLNAPTTVSVLIETPDKNILVQAEPAITDIKKAIGLMYRSDLPDDNGMIFLYPHKRVITMWMKNTYIPLDMIFFNEYGVISHIHKNAVPMDETVISSQTPAIGVLEVNAGFADKHGIQTGQKLTYPPIQTD